MANAQYTREQVAEAAVAALVHVDAISLGLYVFDSECADEGANVLVRRAGRELDYLGWTIAQLAGPPYSIPPEPDCPVRGNCHTSDVCQAAGCTCVPTGGNEPPF